MRWLPTILVLSAMPAEAGQAVPRDFAHLWCSAAERADAAQLPFGAIKPSVMPPLRPRYPRSTDEDREGWADVLVILTRGGSVRRVCVLAAQPEGWLEQRAIDAVVRRRFRRQDVAKLKIKAEFRFR